MMASAASQSGNKKAAAQLLGLSRRALYRKLDVSGQSQALLLARERGWV